MASFPVDPKPVLSALAAFMFFSLMLYELQEKKDILYRYSKDESRLHILTACIDEASSIADQLTLYSKLLGVQALNPRLDGVALPYNRSINSMFYLSIEKDIKQTRSLINTDWFCWENKRNPRIKHLYDGNVGHLYFIPWSNSDVAHYVSEDDISIVDGKLREHFVLISNLTERAKKYFHQLNITENVILVGLDIKTVLKTPEKNIISGHNRVQEGYILKAIEYYRNKFVDGNITYITLTDDITWTRKVLKNIPNVIYLSSEDDIFNLALLSYCNHSIITGGRFGWWAAWLTNGNTVYFKDWPVPGMKLESHSNKSLYYPMDWVPL